MNIIVTGGLGFIGKNFCESVSEIYVKKFVIDKVTYASDLDFFYEVLKPKGWKLIVADIVDIENYRHILEQNHLVVNFAAESHVDSSFNNVDRFTHSNTLGTQKVIEFCLKYHHRLLHISTDEVYGEQAGAAVDETHILSPTNPYSATKAAADLFVQTYIKCFNLDAKIVRANNIFGPRQLVEKVIPKAIFCAQNQLEFQLHGTKEIRRHFLHTSDFNNALQIIVQSWDQSSHRIFNIASDNDVSIRELVEKIYKLFSITCDKIEIGQDRPFNDQQYAINDDRLRQLGWSPSRDFWIEIQKLCSENSYLLPLYT